MSEKGGDSELLEEDVTSAQGSAASENENIEAEDTASKHSDTIEPNTFNIKPNLEDMFKATIVESAIHDILTEELSGKTYTPEDAKQWTTNIADIINRKVREMKWKRYKHIVHVLIGEQRGAGVKSGVKCVWDAETDNYASSIFINDTLFCMAAVFAIYFY